LAEIPTELPLTQLRYRLWLAGNGSQGLP